MDENIKSVTTIADKNEDETTEYQPFAADYDNADFNMLVREERMYYLFIDEISGDVFNDTVYERNNKVQEYYNVKLKTLSTRLCKRSHKFYESQPYPQSKSSIPRMTPQLG